MMHNRMVYFGGHGMPLHFAVANGFPPETYTPLLSRLTAEGRVLSVLPRALWDEPVPDTWLDWRDGPMRDMLAGWDALGLDQVVAVGHSFGGVISMLAALEAPARIRALVLLDPTFLAPDILTWIEVQYAVDRAGLPLAARALRRRRDFPDGDTAFAYFRERELFSDWSDELLWGYVHTGLRRNDDGVLTLRWSPEWEAHVFSTAYLKTWDALARLAALDLPVLIVRGAQSDTFTEDSLHAVRQLLPKAVCVQIPDQGHLFPLAAPSETAALISTFLAGR